MKGRMNRTQAARLLRRYAEIVVAISWLGSQTAAPDYEEYRLRLYRERRDARRLLLDALVK